MPPTPRATAVSRGPALRVDHDATPSDDPTRVRSSRRPGSSRTLPMVTVPARAPSLGVGAMLGPYELLSLVGSGGMGNVWAARRADDTLFAVKTILPAEAQDASVRSMFLDEARIAQMVVHPNVCRLADFGNDQGTLYMAFEWVEGDSLRALLRASDNAPVPAAVALRIGRRLCEALHAAHELRGNDGQTLGLVHRDVSTHNVLLGIDGSVKLIDFGIAKMRQRLAETTTSGVIKGKLRYMAPEQIEGGAVDRRADVWSAGAVLYELLAGEPLFYDLGEAAILRTLVMREPLPPFPAHVPPALAALLARTLAYEPDERFPTARALGDAMSEALGALGERTDDADPAGRALLEAFARAALGETITERRAALAAACQASTRSTPPRAAAALDAPPPAASRSPRATPFIAAAALAVALGTGAWLTLRTHATGAVASDRVPAATFEVAAAPSTSSETIVPPSPGPTASARPSSAALHRGNKGPALAGPPAKRTQHGMGSEFDTHN